MVGEIIGDLMTLSEAISGRILSICRKRRLSINRLAEMSGLTQSTVDSIINGKSKRPNIVTLSKIALGFNMTIVEFLDCPEIRDELFSDVISSRKQN